MSARDQPWLMRTYSGHSSAKASNELYRTNLAKGQTGLSVAFDLPTQTGYDPDHPLARGEVGKVGVPVPHLGEMAKLFDGIPLEDMNTSMTINATAMWLLGMYLALADSRGITPRQLSGTIQNDIVKEYLSRGTYIFPPEASKRLTVDVITYTVQHAPRWNPINVCPYHLQEAGATPVQELAYSLATAVDVLDAVRASGQVSAEDFPQVVGRVSFFVDAGIRFVEEMCKMRAFSQMWESITRERYGVSDAKLRRFRYGVQVNSLGLTEAQPENNIQRIVLEMLGVTLSKDARARAVQLPCWNEALGLPRAIDQQWSLRIQQVLAEETDLLEYDDLFEGSKVVEAKTASLVEEASTELQWVLDGGGAFEMIDAIKARIVASHAARVRAIETGELSVVGVNRYVETAPSPLLGSSQASILELDPVAESEQIAHLRAWREQRDDSAVKQAIAQLRATVSTADNLMPASIELARVGGTVGEWADVLREAFGEYRAPTGLSRRHRRADRAATRSAKPHQRRTRRWIRRTSTANVGRKARPRRTLERRRTDRCRCPRCRHRSDLPGDSSDNPGDCRRRTRRGRRHHRALHPFGLTPRAGRRHPPASAGSRRQGPRRRRWHHPRT